MEPLFLNRQVVLRLVTVTLISIGISLGTYILAVHFKSMPVTNVTLGMAIVVPLVIAPILSLRSARRLYEINRLHRVLKLANEELEKKNRDLEQAIFEIKSLREIIPICSACKKVRNDKGYYEVVETYLSRHSNIDFSHTLCPDCIKSLYPDVCTGSVAVEVSNSITAKSTYK